MHIATRLLSIAVMLALVLGGFTAVPAAQSVPWQSKVDPWVLQTAPDGQTEFLAFLTEQADLSPAAGLATRLEKGTFVFDTLTEVANRTQPAVIADLKARGVQYRPFWVANMIWMRGGTDVVQAMAQRSDIAHIYANPKVKLDLPEVTPSSDAPASPDTIEWNILKVNADDVWAQGFTGQGAVVAGQDTGYQWNHPALINQYRGWDGSTSDHNYNWHDAIHSGGGVCGPDSPEPCDDHGHGTHTMGTIVGDDGGSNQIGMAPGARWIGCRNMDQGVGTPDTYAECYQWFIAPTDLNDQNPDPSKAPDAINNSWGCPVSEGCTDPNVLLTVVNNVRAAGILTNHSAGNEGYWGCSTVSTPAAIYDASFTVGATDSSDDIAYFSSRGPVTVDGSGRMKPDISAPGVNIRSSVPGGDYEDGWSGTSMAGPHVTGLVALLISAAPGLAGQVDTLENVIEQSAVPRTTNQGCGGDGSTYVPNNVYGWGRIDALAAFESIDQDFNLTKSASAETVLPGEVFTYTIDLTNSSAALSANNVVLTDTLPAATTFITATQPYTLSGDMLTWTAPSLSPGGVWTVQLAVQAPVTFTGSVVNENYAVKSDEVSAVAGLPVLTKIHALDLVKTASTELVSNGDRITYTLTITNLHPLSATHNVVLTDTLPVGTEFITATQTYTLSGDMDMATWTAPSLDPGESWTVQLTVEVLPEASSTIINEDYYVTSDEVVVPIDGAPVITLFRSTVYFPKIFNRASTD